jgi:hypothetical protein
VSDETLRVALSDSEKLILLAAWFDMWDRPETDRQTILDDPRNPGRNDVQRDLRRIALALATPEPAPALDRLDETYNTDAAWEALADDDHIYASSAFRREAITRHRRRIEAAIERRTLTRHSIREEGRAQEATGS